MWRSRRRGEAGCRGRTGNSAWSVGMASGSLPNHSDCSRASAIAQTSSFSGPVLTDTNLATRPLPGAGPVSGAGSRAGAWGGAASGLRRTHSRARRRAARDRALEAGALSRRSLDEARGAHPSLDAGAGPLPETRIGCTRGPSARGHRIGGAIIAITDVFKRALAGELGVSRGRVVAIESDGAGGGRIGG